MVAICPQTSNSSISSLIEQKVQNNALYKAITDVMAGILGREPTDAEMLGIEDVSGHKRRTEE